MHIWLQHMYDARIKTYIFVHICIQTKKSNKPNANAYTNAGRTDELARLLIGPPGTKVFMKFMRETATGQTLEIRTEVARALSGSK